MGQSLSSASFSAAAAVRSADDSLHFYSQVGENTADLSALDFGLAVMDAFGNLVEEARMPFWVASTATRSTALTVDATNMVVHPPDGSGPHSIDGGLQLLMGPVGTKLLPKQQILVGPGDLLPLEAGIRFLQAPEELGLSEGAEITFTARFDGEVAPPEELRWTDSDNGADFEWYDISDSGHEVGAVGDDRATIIPIGFDFRYFGQDFHEAYVGTNGLLAFSSEGVASRFFNTDLPNPQTPNSVIAPFWDDLIVAESSQLKYLTLGSTPNRRLVVSWSDVELSGREGAVTFQLVLEEGTSTVWFNYLTSTGEGDGRSASIGLENSDGTRGIMVSLDTSYVHDELSVTITGAGGN